MAADTLDRDHHRGGHRHDDGAAAQQAAEGGRGIAAQARLQPESLHFSLAVNAVVVREAARGAAEEDEERPGKLATDVRREHSAGQERAPAQDVDLYPQEARRLRKSSLLGGQIAQLNGAQHSGERGGGLITDDHTRGDLSGEHEAAPAAPGRTQLQYSYDVACCRFKHRGQESGGERTGLR